MDVKVVAFDFGHTLIDERRDGDIALASRPVHLMPEVPETLPQISFPLAVWANTRVATAADLRNFLDRAGIGRFFKWIVTSVDVGHRKPAPEFFDFALSNCGCARGEVLFVGNQLNTDILGGRQYGIRTVWLSADVYRSADETLTQRDVQPTYMIRKLGELPSLLQHIAGARNRMKGQRRAP